MTAEEAVEQARLLWGNDAAVCNDEKDGHFVCMVGIISLDSYVIRGRGHTWEEAFANAAQRPLEEMVPLK